MKKGILAALVCAMALCVALVGCGSGKTDYSKNFIGKWEIESMSSDGEELDADYMNLMRTFGANIVLNLEKDGIANLDVMGENLSCTWEAKSASTLTITPQEASEDVTPGEFELKDDKLVGDFDDASFIFVKNDNAKASSQEGITAWDDTFEEEGEETAEVPINMVVADDELCTIEIVSAGEDFSGDPGYTVKVTNNDADTTLVVYCDDTCVVNGKSVDGWLNLTVKPGTYAEEFMYFSKDDIGGGVEALTDVSGTIAVVNDDTWENLATYDFSL